MSRLTSDALSATEGENQQFLVFSLGEEEYAIDILKVQEILGYENVTRIANAPDFIKGVTNLRGVIVPIVDLRIKFHLDKVEYGGQTVVIVVNVFDRIVGIVVDGVSDVMTLTPNQIKPAPELGMSMSSDFLKGLGSLENRMLVLVDIDRLLTSKEMALVEQVEQIEQVAG
ncbi:chemotaxis protein CheW [Halochromatium roseum]|uniref:chemotaxis protein CheW n=1 Tax=Halochromatium roseum TaxID=391920 RepID=UPI00191156A1|nr:chemotaxis protein CheW [Halochromatium roseum]MBK5939739.1 chemotaxis protein CheW [Halochromatium roseum]